MMSFTLYDLQEIEKCVRDSVVWILRCCTCAYFINSWCAERGGRISQVVPPPSAQKSADNGGRCRIEFWPHWISTRGVLIQRAVLRIQRIFHVELRPQRQGVIELRPLRRIKFGPPVELWPRVLIPRWIMTLGINFTLNFDPESWFNVKLWPGIGITI